MEPRIILIAFLLTLFAGLSTGIGSAIGFFAQRTNTRFLATALGFSAGVMMYVSFVELLPHSFDALGEMFGRVAGSWIAAGSFFAGILLIAVIDKLIPEQQNVHEIHGVEELTVERRSAYDRRLLRTGLVTALAIAVHNFPEGIATFAATLKDPLLGVSVAVAIGIHNIPEGIAVSVPVYYATGSRKKAFFYSFLSGLSEPLGALIGFLILLPLMNDLTFGLVFGMIAGIMVYISLDELLPTAQKYGEHHLSIYGLVAGMVIMAVSLLMFIR
ncbi:MAG: zinc transporter ZupT [Chitinispirillaceae bacterium]|nr:zinc transporter ZupT [Chitinispirillaceae bacterium]